MVSMPRTDITMAKGIPRISACVENIAAFFMVPFAYGMCHEGYGSAAKPADQKNVRNITTGKVKEMAARASVPSLGQTMRL